MICEKCGCNCEISLANINYYPWNEDHWICPECDSTYMLESLTSSMLENLTLSK